MVQYPKFGKSFVALSPWREVDLELVEEGEDLVLGEAAEEAAEEVFLAGLAEDHAVESEGAAGQILREDLRSLASVVQDGGDG